MKVNLNNNLDNNLKKGEFSLEVKKVFIKDFQDFVKFIKRELDL